MEVFSEFWSMLSGVGADRVRLLAENNIAFALALCFASGLLTSLTPCVYPMIPITLNIFGRAARANDPHASGTAFNARTFQYAVIYVAGMCLTYCTMGLVAGLTGSLFGKVLQSPWMLGFLALLFFVLALGQWGLFKIQLPPSVQTRLASMGSGNNRTGIFLMGLFSGLIVSPCVGPVIAGILAFVFDTSNAWLGSLYFLSFSLGLGVLFLVIGAFSGLLGKLPRSGAWMVRINRILASLMLVASGYYGLLLARQMGWAGQTTTASGSGIAWVTSEAEAIRLAQEQGKPIFIDFSAEWCAACHEIDRYIFTEPAFQQKLKDFIPLRIDVTADTPENEQTLERYSVMALPTIVFADKQGNALAEPRINGFLPLDQFLDAMKRVAP